ncbi:MAG: type III pantothenate kinase [Spirochaetia bacterium]|nr:type III pantothenate kinase [Spirochaetia bacterium]
MLLCIDAGNTNIVVGIYQDVPEAGATPRTLGEFRLRTVPSKTEDEYATQFKAMLADSGVECAAVRTVVVSSVVPPLTKALLAMGERLFGVEPLLVGPGLYPKLPVKVVAADEIGTDLVADAVAARARAPGASIVVDFGTALTFTAISADGLIEGVAIAPGLGTAINALTNSTAQLPSVPLVAPPSALGRNTVQAIQSGVVFGYAGLVESVVRRMKSELGGSATVIATGGLHRVVAPLVGIFDAVEPTLTLDGLALIARAVGP